MEKTLPQSHNLIIILLLSVLISTEGLSLRRGVQWKYPQRISLIMHQNSHNYIRVHRQALKHFDGAPFSFALLTGLVDDPFENDVFDEMDSPFDGSFYDDDDDEFSWTEWPQEPYNHIDDENVVEELELQSSSITGTSVMNPPSEHDDQDVMECTDLEEDVILDQQSHQSRDINGVINYNININHNVDSKSLVTERNSQRKESVLVIDGRKSISTQEGVSSHMLEINESHSNDQVDNYEVNARDESPETSSKKISTLLQAAVKAAEAVTKSGNMLSQSLKPSDSEYQKKRLMGMLGRDDNNSSSSQIKQNSSKDLQGGSSSRRINLRPLNLDFTSSHKHSLSFDNVSAAQAYLSLPASEYSVLDKSIISRSTESPNDTFILNLPIGDLLAAARMFPSAASARTISGGTSTVLKTSVTVTPDVENGVVNMRSGPLLLETTIKNASNLFSENSTNDQKDSTDIAMEILAQALPEWLIWAGDKSIYNQSVLTALEEGSAEVKSSIQAGFELQLRWKEKKKDFWKPPSLNISKAFNFNHNDKASSVSSKESPSYVPWWDTAAFSDEEDKKEEAHLWSVDGYDSRYIGGNSSSADTAAAIEAAVSVTSEAFAAVSSTAGNAVSAAVNATMEAYETTGLRKRVQLLALLVRRNMLVLMTSTLNAFNRYLRECKAMLLQLLSKYPAVAAFLENPQVQKLCSLMNYSCKSFTQGARYFTLQSMLFGKQFINKLNTALVKMYMRQREAKIAPATITVKRYTTGGRPFYEPFLLRGAEKYGSSSDLSKIQQQSSSNYFRIKQDMRKKVHWTNKLTKIKSSSAVSTSGNEMSPAEKKLELEENNPKPSKLQVAADIKVWVDLSLPIQEDIAGVLNVLPVRALLGQAGSLIVNTVLKSASPKLSRLLIEDYENWKSTKYQY